MNGPQSPFLSIGIALATAAIAFICHRLVQAIEANSLMPLSEKLRGDKGREFPMQGTWPFRDKHHVQSVRRSLLHFQLIVTKWAMVFVTLLLGVLYPVIYAIRFAEW